MTAGRSNCQDCRPGGCRALLLASNARVAACLPDLSYYLPLLSLLVSSFISLFPLSFIFVDWTSILVAWFELGSKLARTSSPSLSCSSSATWVPSRVIVALGAIFTSCSTPAEDKTLSDRLSLSTFLTTPESSLLVSSLLALAVVPVSLGGVWVADDLPAGAICSLSMT